MLADDLGRVRARVGSATNLGGNEQVFWPAFDESADQRLGSTIAVDIGGRVSESQTYPSFSVLYCGAFDQVSRSSAPTHLPS